MKNQLKHRILSELKDYRRNMQQIALLRYELMHYNRVSSTEIIETMALSRNGTTISATGNISDKTYYVATKHEANTFKLNEECFTAIATQLNVLETKTRRLKHCVAQLNPQYTQVISLIYFDAVSIKAVATQMHMSERTIQRYRDAALDELVILYDFLFRTNAL